MLVFDWLSVAGSLLLGENAFAEDARLADVSGPV